VDLDAEHRALVRTFPVCFREPEVRFRVFLSTEEFKGGDHGTRNPALAARRADTGDYSVVAVLRTLTSGDRHGRRKTGSAVGRACFLLNRFFHESSFSQIAAVEIHKAAGLFAGFPI
jgi:hypothetical protein